MVRGTIFTTSHGCSCDPQWQYLVGGSVLAVAVAVNGHRGSRQLVRVVDRGSDPTHMMRICAGILISGISDGVQGLSFTFASDGGDPDAPRTFWLFCPKGFDVEGFVRLSLDGAIPEELELEFWTKARFDGFVAEAKDICMDVLDLIVEFGDVNAFVTDVVENVIGLKCEFIWSMVVGEVEKAIRSDRGFVMASMKLAKSSRR